LILVLIKANSLFLYQFWLKM